MRRVPAGSFERLSSFEALWAAWLRCRRGKRRHPDVAAFELDVDRELLRLRDVLRDASYRPGRCALRIIHDPKRRLIAAPPVVDRVVHQAVVEDLRPHFDRSAIDHSYATGAGRGAHRAVTYHLGCTRRFRWRLALDVRRYFPSVDRERLRALVFRRVSDPGTRRLVDQLLHANEAVYATAEAIDVFGLDADPLPPGRGLAIGTYFSQWAGDLYLRAADHVAKRTLKVAGYLRYIDDLTLFGDDADALSAAGAELIAWLAEHRGLTLRSKEGGVQSTRRGCTFLGYRVTRAGLRPGPKMRRRMPRKLAEAAAKGPKALERTVASYRGLMWF